jgi:hypothetical protein
LPFHFLGLGSQQRLPDAAELTSESGVDGIGDCRRAADVGELCRRFGDEAADNPERDALDFRFDFARRLDADDLDVIANLNLR